MPWLRRSADFWGLIFGPGIFLGFDGSPRDRKMNKTKES